MFDWLNVLIEQFQFSSFEEFLAMGNHGLYVWLSYGVGIIALTSIFIAPKLKRKTILKELAQRNRRAQLNQHNTHDTAQN